MLRFLSKQAVKAVPRPFRLSTGTSRRIHNLQLPYSGPPSYETISRRFSSSNVDPQAYFINKRQQAAKERGEYTDIHDIGGVDPRDYDVLISDVDKEKLRGEIAEIVGIKYLAEATVEEANKVVDIGDCYLFGHKLRTIFPAVVCDDVRAHWVFFIVDSGAPLTYISTQTSDLFDIQEERIGPARVKIAGRYHPVYRSPTDHFFTELNILGMDFFNFYDVSQVNDFKKARAKLYFGTDWEMAKKSKL